MLLAWDTSPKTLRGKNVFAIHTRGLISTVTAKRKQGRLGTADDETVLVSSLVIKNVSQHSGWLQHCCRRQNYDLPNGSVIFFLYLDLPGSFSAHFCNPESGKNWWAFLQPWIWSLNTDFRSSLTSVMCSLKTGCGQIASSSIFQEGK